MKTTEVNNVFQNPKRLNRELAADPTLGPNFLNAVNLDDKTIFQFTDDYDSADESYLVFTFIPGFVDQDNDSDFEPKIYDLLKGESAKKNHTQIDYIIEIENDLFPKRTMVKGEIQKVEWFSDQALTDKVLETNISYVRDPLGFAVSRTTERVWFQRNGDPHPDKKVTTKLYTINPIEQISEGKRRRGNIVDGLQLPTMSFLLEVLAPTPPAEIVLVGRDFLDRFESEFNKFIDNSSTVTDPLDPNFGRKNLAVAFENAPDTWLDDQPTPLGGMTIRTWLIGEVSI